MTLSGMDLDIEVLIQAKLKLTNLMAKIIVIIERILT